MEAHTEGRKQNGKQKGTKGRINEDKQEAVTKPEVIKDCIEELEQLDAKAKAAAEALSDAIKAAAQASGYNAAAVRKLVAARSGERFAEAKRLTAQHMELFEEVGE